MSTGVDACSGSLQKLYIASSVPSSLMRVMNASICVLSASPCAFFAIIVPMSSIRTGSSRVVRALSSAIRDPATSVLARK